MRSPYVCGMFTNADFVSPWHNFNKASKCDKFPEPPVCLRRCNTPSTPALLFNYIAVFSCISSFPNTYSLVVDGSITPRLALRDPTNVSCGVGKDLRLLMAASVTFLSTPSAMNKAAVCLIYRTLFITESWIDSCRTASERLVASYRLAASSFCKSSLYINEKVVSAVQIIILLLYS